MNHGGTITEFNGIPYIVWRPDELYPQFRHMQRWLKELEVYANNVWLHGTRGDDWEWLSHRMTVENFEKLTGEKVMIVQPDRTDIEYPVNEWFQPKGQIDKFRDGYFLIRRNVSKPDDIPKAVFANEFPMPEDWEFCYIPIPEKPVEPLQGIGLNEPKAWEEFHGTFTCASSNHKAVWIVRTLHPDKETAIRMHNEAMKVHNEAAGE